MTPSPTKRILVTGGTGFIGRHTAASLANRGFEVHMLVRDKAAAHSLVSPAVLHEGDLFDAAAVSQLLRDVTPSHLLHLAWDTTHGKFWTSPHNLAWVQASLNLVRSFAAAGGQRLVCAGTCAEYDWSEGHCCEHSTPTRPATFYGLCKNNLRELLERYAALEGMQFAWGRLFFLYGPGENPARLVPSLMLSLTRGEHAECRSGQMLRDFLHTADAADAFAALAESPVEGAVNIASGQATPLAQLATRIAAIAGLPDLLRIGTSAAASDQPRVLTADTTRLNQEVGWRPRINLDQGLAALWQRYEREDTAAVVHSPFIAP